MDIPLILSLTGLALLDSTSIGTLFIPVWLLLAPGGVNPGQILLYLATMLPYLAAIAILSTSELPTATMAGLLAAYCVVMVVPALFLLTVRQAGHGLVQPLLLQLDAWVSRHGETTVGWIIGIAGFLVASDALGKLNLGF